MTYYFDVIPHHPQPEYLGSLTSYLMRLVAYKGISSIDGGISALSFPQQDRRTLTVVEGMEHGFQSRGATLQSYFKYAHYLCLSLKEVFSDVIDAPNHVPSTALPLCPACQQSYYITRDGYNRSGSQRYQCQHCHRSFTASPKAREVERLSS